MDKRNQGQDDDEIEEDDIRLPDEVEDDREDAGLGNDESGDASQTGQELEAEAQGEKRVESRATRRVQEALREAREAKERAQLLERELENARRERQQPQQQPQEESDEAFFARVSLLEPMQQVDAKLARAEKRHQRELFISNLRSADALDKADYNAKAAGNPRYKKYAAEVERILAEERQAGRWNTTRETIYYYVLGKAADQVDPKRKQKQRDDAQERVSRQQARDSGGRSDVSASRQRTGQGNTLADLERRLEGKFI